MKRTPATIIDGIIAVLFVATVIAMFFGVI
jgi:hypothetical protein